MKAKNENSENIHPKIIKFINGSTIEIIDGEVSGRSTIKSTIPTIDDEESSQIINNEESSQTLCEESSQIINNIKEIRNKMEKDPAQTLEDFFDIKLLFYQKELINLYWKFHRKD